MCVCTIQGSPFLFSSLSLSGTSSEVVLCCQERGTGLGVLPGELQVVLGQRLPPHWCSQTETAAKMVPLEFILLHRAAQRGGDLGMDPFIRAVCKVLVVNCQLTHDSP